VTTLWPIAVLILIVGSILLANRLPVGQVVFRWLPVPLWCYALPLLVVSLGWLPADTPIYRSLTEHLLPIALILLLLGVDLAAVARTSAKSLIAAVAGALAIILGAPAMVWLLRNDLPTEAWKGAGSLAGTWTGGTMNLLALRPILDTPEEIFAPLIIVDAVVAYSWMILLVAASGFQTPINRWLKAKAVAEAAVQSPQTPRLGRYALAGCALIAVSLTLIARWLAPQLPLSPLVSSATGWTVLLATTAALGFSLTPPVRQLGAHGSVLGYPALYLVLAATGAQANVEALWSAPAWLMVGAGVALLHGAVLLGTGRLCRIPLGMLATASQANLGGVVSAPLVGAVYHQSLAPVGLLLAMAGNALGTYLGWLSATFCRWLL
jgi:uncharacterized membrane protein